jgi:hypothetical protein
MTFFIKVRKRVHWGSLGLNVMAALTPGGRPALDDPGVMLVKKRGAP